MLKENRFTLANGDICEVRGTQVINISDFQRCEEEAKQRLANMPEDEDIPAAWEL